jgi:hypothetical protein
MVVNIVDVGWATSKSGCLPISALYAFSLAWLAAEGNLSEGGLAQLLEKLYITILYSVTLLLNSRVLLLFIAMRFCKSCWVGMFTYS